MNDNPDYSKEAIAGWMRQAIARMLSIDECTIDVDAPFPDVGLDSADSIGLTGLLGTWLQVDIDPEMPTEYPTIVALAGHLEWVMRSRGMETGPGSSGGHGP